jgi:tRNA A-37 threonylcarbamoyl transferase component Bud32
VTFSANPYLNRTAIKDDRAFFGRRRELAIIFSRIDAGEPQSVSLVGERRIGKSSLLRAVLRRRSQYLRRPDEFVFVYLDLHETVHSDVATFFIAIIEELSLSLRDTVMHKTAPTYENIRSAVAKLDRARLKLVLLLDEFEAVTQNENFTLEFFSFLRSLPNNYSVSFIVSSARELQELCHSKELAGSPFFNIFHKLNLGPFTPEEAGELIEQPSSAAGYPLQPYAPAIIRLGGYFPFFLQMACCTFFENRADPGQIRIRFQEQAIGHFQYVWDHLSERERAACAKIIERRELNEQDRSFADALIRRGYVWAQGGGIRLFSEAFDEFVKSKLVDTEAVTALTSTVNSSRTWRRDLPGRTVGRFLIREVLGSGGMGEVYLARDTKLKRLVAMKRIARHLRDQPEYRRRLLNEAERASQLNHPKIVGIYDLIEEEDDIFLIMEYVQGQTLRTRIAAVRLDELLNIARQCADALALAHQKGIVHCDIKPENILITPQADVKILDFGIAKYLPQLDTEALTRDGTITNIISGTLAYMAPEILMEQMPDARSDIFSFGIVFYELWSGRHPFRSNTRIETANRIMTEQPSSLMSFVAGTPASLDQIIAKCLSKKPADRYQDALSLLSDLSKVESARANSGEP